MKRVETNHFVALPFLILIINTIITIISPCFGFGETSRMNFYTDLQRKIGGNTFGETLYGVHFMWMNLSGTF